MQSGATTLLAPASGAACPEIFSKADARPAG